jgi:hypothetical protein
MLVMTDRQQNCVFLRIKHSYSNSFWIDCCGNPCRMVSTNYTTMLNARRLSENELSRADPKTRATHY